jgi:hypothetical protein
MPMAEAEMKVAGRGDSALGLGGPALGYRFTGQVHHGVHCRQAGARPEIDRLDGMAGRDEPGRQRTPEETAGSGEGDLHSPILMPVGSQPLQ